MSHAMELQRRATPQLQDFLERSAERDPDKIALVFKQERLSYRQLDRRANALAHALVAYGIARGDRVVVFAENTADAVIAFWAALKASAVVCMVNPQTKPGKLAYLLNDCRAKILITDMQLAEPSRAALAQSSYCTTVIVAGPLARDSLPHAVAMEEALRRDGSAPPRCANLDIDLAAIIYTSGSTGDPKGVMLTHRNMLTAATSIATYLELRADEVILSVLPLAFDYGLYQMIVAFGAGARLILERSFAYPAQVLNLFAQEKVTGFPGVPTMFSLMVEMKTLAAFDFSSLRFVTNTAAALPLKHIQALSDLFPGVKIYSMYGLTECKRCTYLPPEDLRRKPGSVGVAIPNTELWIVDENDHPVGANVVGELVIRGATVMAGYWEKPEATARKLRPGPLPGERVLYTGDLCRLDDDGYLYFIGRTDDIIKSRGEKIAPKEVESAIMNIAGVKEAAVVGVAHELLGQAVKAFVVLEAQAHLGVKDIVRECQLRLESFMVPRDVELVAELPKTNTGKIKKTGLGQT